MNLPLFHYLCSQNKLIYIFMLRIQAICKEQGVSLSELASRLGIQYQSLYDSINGNPTLKRLQDIAFHLGVNVKDLFEDDDDTSALKCPHCGKPLNIKIE